MSFNYDYIIVGGGTAGCVLANRLSEDLECRVLVIEAGKHHKTDFKIDTPGMIGAAVDNPEYDWCFFSEPQEHMGDRQISQPRGKMLGRSSGINYLTAVWPSKASIDAWQQLGNETWSWNTLDPYFSRCQTLKPPSEHVRTDLSLQDVDGSFFYGPVHKSWFETSKNLDLAMTGDPISGDAHGAYLCSNSIDPITRTRSYAAPAYLHAAVTSRPNPEIMTEALVERILFSDPTAASDIFATGVQVRRGQKVDRILAGKEVIICAGTYGSPHLLELSGIGNATILKRHGIVPIVDNPHVGENLQDHPACSLGFEVADGVHTAEDIKIPGVLDQVMRMYAEDRRGPLTGAANMTAFFPLVEFLNSTSDPETKTKLTNLLNNHIRATDTLPSLLAQHDILRSIVQNPLDTTCQYFCLLVQLDTHLGPTTTEQYSMKEDGHYMTITASFSHPFSRGSVLIKSADPSASPAIDPKYVSNPIDLELFARHVLFIETMAASPPLSDFVKKEGRRCPPITKLETLEDAKEHIRKHGSTTYHPVGTCAMMPREKGGVVDEELRVYGVKGLRVVDASIMPMIPRGNIQTTVYALAERAAEIIKGKA